MRLFGKYLLQYLPAHIVPALLAFVSILIFTRILTAEQFGQYTLVMTSVTVTVTLFSWLNMAIIRFYPSLSKQDVAILVRTSFWVQLLLVGIPVVAALILMYALWPEGIALYRLVEVSSLIIILQTMFYLLTHVLRARLQVVAYSLFTIWAKAASLVLGIILAVYLHFEVLGVLWGIALGLATAFPSLWLKAFTGIKLVGPVSVTLLRDLGLYGLPLMIGNLGSWTLSQSDRYLIKLFYGTREVGMYSAAYWISDHSIALLSSLFMLTSVPLTANIWEKQGQEAGRHLLASITRLYLLIGIPAAVGMSVMAEPLMKIFTGPNFSEGYTIVPWVACGAFFLGLQQRFNQALLLLKRSQTIMIWLIVSGILNVILNLWLLPLLGYEIAAVNTLISYIFLCVTLALASRRYIYWDFPWLTAMRSLLAGFAMCIGILVLVRAVHPSPLGSLCLAIPTGILIYSLSLWVLGEISPAERQAIKVNTRRWFGQQAAGW